MKKEVLPSEEFQRRLHELYEKGDIEGILAFDRKFGERITEKYNKLPEKKNHEQ